MTNFNELQIKNQRLLGADSQLLDDICQQLPDKRFYEYAYHKLIDDPAANFATWNDWKDWSYPIQDLLRFKAIVLDNADVIQNTKVVDFGCHIGYLSLFCLHLGANYVVGTNIRQQCLDIANEIITAAGHSNKFHTVEADLHDYKTNTNLCKDADTAILAGVLYHVHDHYAILESIVAGNPTNVIIDTEEPPSVMDNPVPLISWRLERINNNPELGFYNDQPTLLVGYPNEAFFTFVMQHFGYKKIRSTRYPTLGNCNVQLTKPITRIVQTFVKA